jgi:hypothetical protein
VPDELRAMRSEGDSDAEASMSGAENRTLVSSSECAELRIEQGGMRVTSNPVPHMMSRFAKLTHCC